MGPNEERLTFNRRKRQTLEYFAGRTWTRPTVYAVAVKFYPVDSAYTYLKRLHKMKLLRRGRDVRGTLVYKLSRRGAVWLLRDRGREV